MIIRSVPPAAREMRHPSLFLKLTFVNLTSIFLVHLFPQIRFLSKEGKVIKFTPFGKEIDRELNQVISRRRSYTSLGFRLGKSCSSFCINPFSASSILKSLYSSLLGFCQSSFGYLLLCGVEQTSGKSRTFSSVNYIQVPFTLYNSVKSTGHYEKHG
jgi:hypothetical protein